MFCPFCGSKNSDNYIKCSNCGKENPKAAGIKETQKQNSNNLKIALIAMLVLGLIIAGISSCSNNKTSTSQQRQVLLTAGFERGFIVIRNENSFDWTNAVIKVANGPTNQYSLHVGTIKAGETKSFLLSKFTNSNGEIYDSKRYIPKQVIVSADNASGGKEY